VNRVQGNVLTDFRLQMTSRVLRDGNFIFERRDIQGRTIICKGEQLARDFGDQRFFLAFSSSPATGPVAK
jgi:hypothetical protein